MRIGVGGTPRLRLRLLALSPGAVPQDLRSLSYSRLHRPVLPLDGDDP